MSISRSRTPGYWRPSLIADQVKHQHDAAADYNSYPQTEIISGSNTCTRNAYQRARVSVPVAVKPFTFAGPTEAFCCGDPIIKEIRCTGTKNRICYFTISQEICVEIPIHFGANACVGSTWVDCLEASTDDCDDCQ